MVVEEPHETAAGFAVQHGAHRPGDCRRAKLHDGAEHAGFLQDTLWVDTQAVAGTRTIVLPLFFNCIDFGCQSQWVWGLNSMGLGCKVNDFRWTANEAERGMCFQQRIKRLFNNEWNKSNEFAYLESMNAGVHQMKRILQRCTVCRSRQIGSIRRTLAFIVLFSLFVTFVTFVVLQHRL